jgi:hypothetical protein
LFGLRDGRETHALHPVYTAVFALVVVALVVAGLGNLAGLVKCSRRSFEDERALDARVVFSYRTGPDAGGRDEVPTAPGGRGR